MSRKKSDKPAIRNGYALSAAHRKGGFHNTVSPEERKMPPEDDTHVNAKRQRECNQCGLPYFEEESTSYSTDLRCSERCDDLKADSEHYDDYYDRPIEDEPEDERDGLEKILDKLEDGEGSSGEG